MATLAELEARFLTVGVPTAPIYSDNSSVEVLIDGYEYFEAIRTAIDATLGAGDAIYIVGWWVDSEHPTLQPVTDVAAKSLAELLAEKAAAGVDVRVLIWANPHLLDWPTVSSWFDLTAGFLRVVSRNIVSALRMRSLEIGGSGATPLRGQVLLDHSGDIADSHHQKAVYVKAGAAAIGFLGVDFAPLRWDRPPHDRVNDDIPTGWHDAGIKLTGPAVAGVLENFRSRWHEAGSLDPRTYRLNGTTRAYNPEVSLSPVQGVPALTATAPPHQSVQVLRSLGRVKSSELWGGDTSWSNPALADGLTDVLLTLAIAIDFAEKYIYIEDQAFNAPLYLFPNLVRACKRGVKVIAVIPGVADPHDVDGDPTIPRVIPEWVQTGIIDPLGTVANRSNFALYQSDRTVVHAKLVLIDDRFICVGSANFLDRSMSWTRRGSDSELSVAAVDAGALVRDTRRRLWSDHLNVDPEDAEVRAQLDPLESALGLWRGSWATTAAPSFPRPRSKLALVGP